MRTFVLILLPAAALVVWAIVEERKLRAMDSGAGKAMQQVGVRLAACLDAVAALLDLTWDYTARQAPQAETVRSGQGVIVSASQAADVTSQEALALDALRYVETVAVQYPCLLYTSPLWRWRAIASAYRPKPGMRSCSTPTRSVGAAAASPTPSLSKRNVSPPISRPSPLRCVCRRWAR